METGYYRTLIVVAETGSFSKAAPVLHLTQSAVSQRIKFLEEQYGQQLINRSGHHILPTEAGKIVIDRGRQILAVEKELIEALSSMQVRHRISVVCTPTFGIAYLPRVFNMFMLRHTDIPNLKFTFQTAEQVIKGVREKDFVVGVLEHCNDLDISGLKSFLLPEDELLFISSPSLGLRAGSITIDKLMEHRLIARKDGCSSRKLLQSNLSLVEKKIDNFRNLLVHDDLRLTIDMVEAGSGIAFVSRSLVDKKLKEGVLVEHKVEGFTHVRSRALILNQSTALEGSLKSFVKCIFETFGFDGIRLSGNDSSAD